MTIYDIAKKFNVNISTVSKALSGSTDIAEGTRKAICGYAEANGYKTRRARAKKGCIAILQRTDCINGECFSDIIEAFRAEAEKENYSVSVHDTGADFDLDFFLAANTCCGIFVLGAHHNSLVARRLKTVKVPAVVLGNQLTDNPLVSSVKSDDLVAVSNAVDRLVSLGHNLIAFLGSEKESLVGAERFAGYFFGLSKNALPYRYDLTYFGDATKQSGKDAAEYFLSYNKYFTAIVCTTQASALGFAEHMQRAGKRIPDDISVICFQENLSSEKQSLTAIVPPLRAIGEQAFAALKATVQGFPAQHITVPSYLEKPDLSCSQKKNFHPADAD